MNKIKMICLDIDGTLLNSQHQISENTKKAIQAANTKKIPVILVSGRMPKGIVGLQRELEIAAPIICYSGALTVAQDASVLAEQVVPISHLASIYEFVKSKNVHVSFYKDDEWYIEKDDKWSEYEFGITNIAPTYINFAEQMKEWQQENTGPNKMLCIAEPETITFLMENITDETLKVYPSKDTYLEIMPKEASKTAAIDFLCQRYEIDQSEILAIGDHFNDVDMLEYAGIGVAMGNAPEEVKKYANDITLTNDEDGVAAALKKYVL